MIRVLPPVLGFLLLVVPAGAEDFTGFYAGANAGYGWGREESKGTPPLSSSTAAPDRAETASALPPSASAAAEGLRRSSNTAGRAAGGR